MAKLSFSSAEIKSIVTVVGSNTVNFLDEYDKYELSRVDALRIADTIGLHSRRVADDNQTTVDLCHQAADLTLSNACDRDQVDALIFVTQSPDYRSPSSAIKLQSLLGLKKSCLAFDINLGCSGYVYGLSVAHSYIESGLNNVLLCVGDVASKLVDLCDHKVSALMGDAGSCTLIQRSSKASFFNLYSDGSGQDALIIPNSGIRKSKRYPKHINTLQMDGGSVFNFTLKVVPDLVFDTLEYACKDINQIDEFVFHQPNKFMLDRIIKKIPTNSEKFQIRTQSIYGNQNSASIPGTINGFLSQKLSKGSLNLFLAGFGVGLSWGGAVVSTDRIFCPMVINSDGRVLEE